MSDADPWEALRRFTPARIALGRAGAAQPTRALLDFALAHARARDAVHAALDADAVGAAIEALGFPVLRVQSAAPDRATYLARPDLGRRLSEASTAMLIAETRKRGREQAPRPGTTPDDGTFSRRPAEEHPQGASRSTQDRCASVETDVAPILGPAQVQTCGWPPQNVAESRKLHPPHAEVAAPGGPRSTHDRGASFEARLRRAPQDEERGGLRSGSQDDGGWRYWTRSVQRQHDESAVPGPRFDLTIVVADGLSAPAVERNAAPLLAALRPWIAAAGWLVGPVVLATQARVALGDEVAASLGASAVLTLVGERPGLSAPDGLGAYLTFAPIPNVTKDAGRNCLSNIRDGGASHAQAAFRIAWLLAEAFRRGLTGVALKDESDRLIVDGRVPEPSLLASEAR